MWKLQNRYLSSLVQWLELQELEGKQNRERIRFINLLRERLKEMTGFINTLVDKLVEKDKSGHPKTIKENGVDVFSFKNKQDKEKYIKELNDIYNEEFKLELTELNKEMLGIIKDIVLNTKWKFGPREDDNPQQKINNIRIAYEYEKWAKSFEELKI